MAFRRSRLNWLAGAALAALGASLAYAASQGTLGTTSTGTIQINASKTSAVMISGLADITFPASSTTPAPASQTACLYSTTGSYTIQATSGNAQGLQFRLKDGGTDYIKYSTDWFNATTGGTDTSLNSGQTSGTISGANTTSTNCGGGTNARVQITIDSTTFGSAPTGAYNDTLTLLVSPV